MARILFCHWFWITLVSGLLLSAAAEDESEELDLVRRGHSFASHKTEPGSSSSGQSVSVSNSVSHVRVEVGNNKHQPTKMFKKKIKKKFKSRKTFLEKIYAKIKEFARVTLATRRGDTVTEPSTSGQDNSETAGNQARDPGAEPQPALHPGTQPALSTRSGTQPAPGANVISFSEFSPGPRQPGQRSQGDQAGADTEEEEEEEAKEEEEVKQEVKQEGKEAEADEAAPPPRSPEARGRSLWLVARPRQLQEEERVAGAEADTAGPSFASWSRERELVWGSGEEAGQLQLGPWSTLVILGVSGATAAAFITVLVAALLYRRAKFRAAAARHCEQLSDTVSTSSRSSASTASTISSTRSRSSVPDKMDIISFHAEGNLRKQAYNCDDLYSLDSDYFLSSLEDISVQI